MLINPSLVATVLQAIGTTGCLYCTYRCLGFLSLYFLPPVPMSRYHPKAEVGTTKPWGLVTGASAGIGLGYAHELAARGFNVILLGRRLSELNKAKTAIQAECPGTEIRILVLDAEKATAEEVDEALNSITDLTLTVIFNNVASLTVRNPDTDSAFRDLQDYEPDVLDATINSTARFMLRVCRRLVPVLSNHASRNQTRALIVNMGSATRFGFPLMVPYAATKGFVHAASMALSREVRYRQHPIDVVAIMLNEIKTQTNPDAQGPDHRRFAKAVLDRVPRAAMRDMLEVTPWFQHAITLACMNLIPEWIYPQVVGKGAEQKIAELAAAKKRKE
ncbi:Very-long-chain 3-oxoacyl-CoA reductase-like protein [Cladobotryum mycophilum]|uniref:Very-long-chain 3-oxoacyl-CoA reductase-like protein n=1 Tax=Cladobotryum mycophilum TaxID=491253 RepID=A0ABR0SHV1_9HYPO